MHRKAPGAFEEEEDDYDALEEPQEAGEPAQKEAEAAARPVDKPPAVPPGPLWSPALWNCFATVAGPIQEDEWNPWLCSGHLPLVLIQGSRQPPL